MLIEKREYRGYEIEICFDDFCDEDVLGDSLGEIVYRSRDYVLGHVDIRDKYSSVEEFEHMLSEHSAVRIPVYAYIHSGVVLKAAESNPFVGRLPQGHAEFDSGQSGVVWVSSERVAAEYGTDTPENRERARRVLIGEVDEFSKYLNGECYMVGVRDQSGNIIDALGGILGWDALEDYIEEAKSTIDAAITSQMSDTFDYHMHNEPW